MVLPPRRQLHTQRWEYSHYHHQGPLIAPTSTSTSARAADNCIPVTRTQRHQHGPPLCASYQHQDGPPHHAPPTACPTTRTRHASTSSLAPSTRTPLLAPAPGPNVPALATTSTRRRLLYHQHGPPTYTSTPARRQSRRRTPAPYHAADSDHQHQDASADCIPFQRS